MERSSTRGHWCNLLSPQDPGTTTKEGSIRQKSRKTKAKRCFLDMVGPLHSMEDSAAATACARPAQGQANQRVAPRGGRIAEAPFQAEALLKASWGRRVSFVLESRWTIPEEE